MAKEIYKGHSPYFGVMDSKNPLIEYYWALVHLLTPWSDIIFSARLAESLWIGGTIFLIVKLISRDYPEYEEKLTTFPILIVSQFILSFWKITDNGLNISIYQSLFEFISIYLGYTLLITNKNQSDKTYYLQGCGLGGAIFLAWMVKQTSLICTVIPLLTFVIFFLLDSKLPKKRIRFISLCLGASVSCFLVGCFFLYLHHTDTFSNYWAGTFTYNYTLSKNGLQSGGQISLLQKVWEYISHPKTLAGSLILVVGLSSLVGLFFIKRLKQPVFFLGIVLWNLAVILQSLGKFTFFNHYFLALVIPALLLLSLALASISRNVSRKWIIACITLVFSIHFTSQLINQKKALRKMSTLSPQTVRIEALEKIIPKDSKVFNWSGLMHYFVESDIESHYEMNQSWFYIVKYHWENNDELNSYMKKKFSNSSPDFFLEQWENYPKDQLLGEFRLTPEILYKWTGNLYEPVLVIPPGNKRYELELILFKKKNNK